MKLNREILRLAVPNILSNISVPLLSTVDTALMGRLSETHLGAVGLAAMIFNFVYWNFGFLRMGTTGITAQAYGRKDPHEIMMTLARALSVAFILAIFLILFQIPLGKLSFYLMNATGAQGSLVAEYFFIRIWAAPATLGLFALMGWFFGMQNAIYPLILTLVINVVNIGLSFLFILHYKMDVDGVAWGTVIAQYTGFLLACVLFLWKYRSYLGEFSILALKKWMAFKRFLVINRDIFIRTIAMTLVYGFFYSQSSAYGEMILAVNVILLQFLHWMAYGIDGFAYASESLVGKYAGAGNPAHTRKAILYSFYWGMGLGLLFSLVYLFAGNQLLWVFTDDPDIIRRTSTYLMWMVVFPLLSAPCFIWDGVFIGLTASRSMRDTMYFALAAFFIFFFGFNYFLGWENHGLLLALLSFMVARGIFQTIWYFSGRLHRETALIPQ